MALIIRTVIEGENLTIITTPVKCKDLILITIVVEGRKIYKIK